MENKTVKDFFMFWREMEKDEEKGGKTCSRTYIALSTDYFHSFVQGEIKNERGSIVDNKFRNKVDGFDYVPFEFLLSIDPKDFLRMEGVANESLKDMRIALKKFTNKEDLREEKFFSV